jgi:2-polyprenyl-6-methoxyphenol hydroxylase-like FAD-dependent oxidoreductase
MRTQVGIVGAGPAGLMLALLLQREGIETVVLEARSREYIEKRVRAGSLEQNTVDLMREIGVDERLNREGLEHTGIYLRHHGRQHRVDMTALTGRRITIYGQLQSSSTATTSQPQRMALGRNPLAHRLRAGNLARSAARRSFGMRNLVMPRTTRSKTAASP